jgi:hypothetical protein
MDLQAGVNDDRSQALQIGWALVRSAFFVIFVFQNDGPPPTPAAAGYQPAFWNRRLGSF